MPCNSEYMNATAFEVNYSRVLCLLDEVKTGRPVDPNSDSWRGYHKKAYACGKTSDLDAAVRALCERLTKVGDVSSYSLELQTWWRDHQAADRKRETLERERAKEEALVKSATKKLTEEELSALLKLAPGMGRQQRKFKG